VKKNKKNVQKRLQEIYNDMQVDDLLKKTKQQKINNTLRGERIKVLFRKHKKLFGAYKRIVPFKEPCAILMRRSKQIELHENIQGEKFEYTHTNGEIYQTKLSPRYLYDFPIGDKTFKTYIIDEDSAFPLAQDPMFEITQFNTIIEKIVTDETKWNNADVIKARGQMWKNILWGAAILILAFVALKYAPGLLRGLGLWKDATPTGAISAAGEILQNVTTIT
jgi:hypothetical protein